MNIVRTVARKSWIEGFRFVKGCLTFEKLTKIPLIYGVAYFNLRVLELCFGKFPVLNALALKRHINLSVPAVKWTSYHQTCLTPLWSCPVGAFNVYEYCWAWGGRRKDFFQGEPVGDFPKIFTREGPKVVKFVFYPSKLKNQPFFANCFKIQGGQVPPWPPFGLLGNTRKI